VATITVVCAYEKNGNSASFDNISLVQHLAYSMSYNDDGKMTEINSSGVVTNLQDDEPDTENDETTQYDTEFEHRLLCYRDELTNTTMTYDSAGNMTSSALSLNANSSMTLRNESGYDDNGNLLIQSTDTNGITVSYEYGSDWNKMLGLPSAVTDAKGTVTNILYDNFGRTTQTSVANRAILEYTYDAGNLTEILRSASSGNQAYSFEYDAFGNMTTVKVGNQVLATYEYASGNGPLTKQTYGNGVYIRFTYDNLGRVKMARYSDGGIVLYYYTGDGQLSCVAENKATYYYFYDVTGQLIASEKRDNSGKMLLRVDLQYDDYGQLLGQTWNIEGTVYSENYTYDEDGTLSSMTTATGQTLQMTYDDLQRLTSVASNLYTKNYSYKNLSDRTTNLVSQLQYASLPTALAFGYTYDALGNIATYTAPDGEVITYTYDNLGQLLSAVGDQTYTYTYDSVGNLLTANGHTYTYGNADWKDLLTAFDGQSITYDASGNPTSYYNGTRWSFTWKNGRKLVSASSANGTITFEYDFDGLRTSKKVGNVTHNYLYANGQLLRETYEDIILDFFYDANGYPYALKYNGTTYYYITNLQGDVMYLVDGTGATVASYAYDPYGNILSATGPMAEINPLRYRGYYYDAELEMYYLQSRYYDPMVGRFINADDVALIGVSGTPLGYNMYAYCENDPVNMLDENGYVGIPWQVQVGLAAGIGSAIWDMTKYIASHWGQKASSWAYIKGLGGALIKGFVRGFVVGVISTIPKNLAYGLLGGSMYLIYGLVTGSVKTVGQGISAFMNGWTFGVFSKTFDNMLANLGRLTGWSKAAMQKIDFIASTFLGFGLTHLFVW
jgi:RHS repeat-associated protein